MNRKTNKNNTKRRSLLVAPVDKLVNETDSDNSLSSNDQLFKNQTLVMDLHGTQNEELPDNPLPEVKTRKLLKKKRPKPDEDQDPNAGSLTSSSEGSVVPPGPENQEEFFDAHETLIIQDNQTTATLNRLSVTSKQTNNPEGKLATPQHTSQEKSVQESTAVSDATTAAVVKQDTGTGLTPLTSAKPIRPKNPE
ncbi:proteoglycan 4-like [Cydia splendana]|uniref:proteoglycan 4-like n=1 Tax=Cydia splendana TaxID=1100963 RepID=UPI00300C45A4